jgi:hypothetical protein
MKKKQPKRHALVESVMKSFGWTEEQKEAYRKKKNKPVPKKYLSKYAIKMPWD